MERFLSGTCHARLIAVRPRQGNRCRVLPVGSMRHRAFKAGTLRRGRAGRQRCAVFPFSCMAAMQGKNNAGSGNAIKRFPTQHRTRILLHYPRGPADEDRCGELVLWIVGHLPAACSVGGFGFQSVKICIFFGLIGGRSVAAHKLLGPFAHAMSLMENRFFAT